MANNANNAIVDAIAVSNNFRMPTGNRVDSRFANVFANRQGENTSVSVAESVLAMPRRRLNPGAAPFVPAPVAAAPRRNVGPVYRRPNATNKNGFKMAKNGKHSRRRRSTRRSTRRANRK